MNHKGKRLFITGIPTSGKSYLAKAISEKTGVFVVHLDNLRESIATDEHYTKWTNFYLDKNEKEYLTTTSPEDQWKNLVLQSEGLWPAFMKEIKKYEHEQKPVVFECVNILPHLAHQYLDFPGIVLIGESFEKILERNIKDPRWSNTVELQKLEAKTFFEIERPCYKAEAERYNYPVFEKTDDALGTALKLLQ